MNAYRCMTDRTYAILARTIGDRARTEKSYKWFGSLPLSVVRGIPAVVAFIMNNRKEWDK